MLWFSFLLRCAGWSWLWEPKSYFYSFLIVKGDTAVKIHMGRQNIQSPRRQLPGVVAGSEVRLISFWKKKKGRGPHEHSTLPNSRELTHQQPTEVAMLPTQACDNTCSSSSSAFHLKPFTVIYGALTTVIAAGTARTEPDFTQGSWLSLPGEAGGGTECHPLITSRWVMLISEKLQDPSRQGQLKWRSSTKGHCFSFSGTI